ncbi:MAG: hypothetical protein ABIG96_04225 [Candidatus Micrarchaeota archaeon]
MMKLLVFVFLLATSVLALTTEDQISLYIRQNENHTVANFYALNSSFYLIFINCIPSVLLEEKDDLYPVPPTMVEDVIGEYIRRGYRGCDNETLGLNFSAISIITQLEPRLIEANGKRAAFEREGSLTELKAIRQDFIIKTRQFREVEFVKVDGDLSNMESNLLNLRRVKSQASIDKLSESFDLKDAGLRDLFMRYDRIMPYYYPAAAVFINATVALKAAQKHYGEQDEWLTQQSRDLMVLEYQLSNYEKDLAIGEMPSPESFVLISLKADSIKSNINRRPPLFPPIFIYIAAAVCIIALAVAIYYRLRSPKKIAEEDMPKIRKLLAKLRLVEQKEEESA